MKYLRKIKKTHLIFIAVLLVAACLIVPNIVSAAWDMNYLLINISSWIAQQIVYVVGQLLLIAIHILIKIASFNEFVDASAVQIGWVIIRDIANLGIVIALMIIAFGTVLNKQSYKFQKMLPQLILAAILVNFSKSIAGLLIDFGQVIMMTFVHAFENIAAGNITYGLGLQDMLSVRNAAQGTMGAEISDWNVFGALCLAVVMVVVALGVVVSMIAMLLMRIVVLWILIIFSPIAFMAGLIPGGKKHVDEWWGYFGKYIVFGPVLAFLFWLSMSVLSQMTGNMRVMNLERLSQEYMLEAEAIKSVDYAYFASQVSSPQRIFDFMVTIALLIMCLGFAQKAGVMGSQVAGNVSGKLAGAGKWIGKRPGTWGKKLGGKAWERTKERAKTSYAAEGLRALKTRVVPDRFTKEGRERAAAKRRAVMMEKLAGAKGEGALLSFQYQQAINKQKEMKEKGLLEGGDDAKRAILRRYLKAGKMNEARAVMMDMASAKDSNLKTEDLEEYRKTMKVEKNSGTQKEKDYMKFMENLKDTQKASGDETAEYKFDVERDSSGKLGYVPEMAKKVHKDWAKKKAADFNNKGIFKAFDEDLPEFKALLDELDEKTDVQSLGTDGREGYQKILERMLARDSDGSDSFSLSVADRTKYTDLLEKMHAKRFVRGTGEAITNNSHPQYANLNNEGKGEVDMGHDSFMEAIDPAHLAEVATKFKRDKAEEITEDRYYGREKLTEVDKKVDQEILRPVMLSNNIQPDLYKLANEDRGNASMTTFTGSVATNLTGVDTKLRDQARKKGRSDVYDANAGRYYTHEELYENSETGKNMQEISNLASSYTSGALSVAEEEKLRKDIENRLDMVVFDAQRAYLPSDEPKGREQTGQHQRNKLMQNRAINKNGLGQAISIATNLQTAEVSEKERVKLIKKLVENVNKAKKHSKKHNLDSEFNTKLASLARRADGLDEVSSLTDLQDFIDDANVLFNQSDAK